MPPVTPRCASIFAGSDESEGVFDDGRGEVEDFVALAAYARERFADAELALAGFSFGGFVAAALAQHVHPVKLVLIAPAVGRFPVAAVPPDTLVVHGEEDDVVPFKDCARLGTAAAFAGRDFSRRRPFFSRPAGAATADRLRSRRAHDSAGRVGLRKSYGAVDVVRGLDLQIRRGECYGLLGPNGAGKTTTLRLCLGQIAIPMRAASPAGRTDARGAHARHGMRLGVVPQSDSLDPDFTVDENMLVYRTLLRPVGCGHPEPHSGICSSLPAWPSADDARIQSLSGGMKRRLSIARALINDPDLIILDEPTTGLDPQARHLIWDRMKQLLGQGKTILLTTHFMDEAERLCHRLSIMDTAGIIASGSPRELIARTHRSRKWWRFTATACTTGQTTPARWPNALRAGGRDRVLLRGRCAPHWWLRCWSEARRFATCAGKPILRMCF